MSTDPKKHDELSDEDMEQVAGACGEEGAGGQQTDVECPHDTPTLRIGKHGIQKA